MTPAAPPMPQQHHRTALPPLPSTAPWPAQRTDLHVPPTCFSRSSKCWRLFFHLVFSLHPLVVWQQCSSLAPWRHNAARSTLPLCWLLPSTRSGVLPRSPLMSIVCLGIVWGLVWRGNRVVYFFPIAKCLLFIAIRFQYLPQKLIIFTHNNNPKNKIEKLCIIAVNILKNLSKIILSQLVFLFIYEDNIHLHEYCTKI